MASSARPGGRLAVSASLLALLGFAASAYGSPRQSPDPVVISRPDERSYWATVKRVVTVRSRPNMSARAGSATC